MQHLTVISLAFALLQGVVSAKAYNPLRQLVKRQDDESFIPPTGDLVVCPVEQICGDDCLTPSRGDVCCPENYGCPGGSFCLTQGYCCPDGLDAATCAADLGIVLTSSVTSLTTTSAVPTSSVVQTSESTVTSTTYSSTPSSSSLYGTATSSSNATQPTPTIEPFTGAASGMRGESWQWVSGGVLLVLGLFI